MSVKQIPLQLIGSLYDALADHPQAIVNIREQFLLPEPIQSHHHITQQQLNQLLLFLSQEKGITDIGLRLGFGHQITHLGTLGHLILACSTLHEAINLFAHYYDPIITSPLPFSFQRNADKLIVTIKVDEQNTACKVLLEDYYLLSLCQMFRQLCGLNCHPLSIRLPHDRHLSMSFIEQKLKTTIQFRNPKSNDLSYQSPQLRFDTQWLDKPLPGSNPRLLTLLSTEIEQLLKRATEQKSILDKITELFSSSTNLRDLSAIKAAYALHTSERTLNRQLKELGTCYRDVFYHYKKQRAIQSLSDNQDIYEIAYDLNFSDRSAFEKAFKKWTGITPAQFRNQSQLVSVLPHQFDLIDLHNLPAISNAGLEVINMINSDDYDISQLAKTLQRDPILTAKIIGLANTAFYGAFKIHSIEDAITRVFGVDLVRNIAIAILSNECFKDTNCAGFTTKDYWLDAFTNAELVSLIAKATDFNDGISVNELYLCGLLKSIGLLFLIHTQPQTISKILKNYSFKQFTCHSLAEEIKAEAGIDQFYTSALLLTHWGLPSRITKVIRPLSSNRSSGEHWRSSLLIRLVGDMSVQLQLSGELDTYPFMILAKLLNLPADKTLNCREHFLAKYDELKTSTQMIMS